MNLLKWIYLATGLRPTMYVPATPVNFHIIRKIGEWIMGILANEIPPPPCAFSLFAFFLISVIIMCFFETGRQRIVPTHMRRIHRKLKKIVLGLIHYSIRGRWCSRRRKKRMLRFWSSLIHPLWLRVSFFPIRTCLRLSFMGGGSRWVTFTTH